MNSDKVENIVAVFSVDKTTQPVSVEITKIIDGNRDLGKNGIMISKLKSNENIDCLINSTKISDNIPENKLEGIQNMLAENKKKLEELEKYPNKNEKEIQNRKDLVSLLNDLNTSITNKSAVFDDLISKANAELEIIRKDHPNNLQLIKNQENFLNLLHQSKQNITSLYSGGRRRNKHKSRKVKKSKKARGGKRASRKA